MKILVFAPHPDDEVLGCGGTIAKHVLDGDCVDLCIVTTAYSPDWSDEIIENKKNEIKKSNEILKINQTFLLGFPTVKLDTIPQKVLNDAISEIIVRIQPEIVYLPHFGDLNKDHRIIYESVLVATRPRGTTIKKILGYETLSETEWGYHLGVFRPNLFVNISGIIDVKIKAMKAYSSELHQSPDPRSLDIIRANAKKRGSEIGVSYAEAFMLIRELIE